MIRAADLPAIRGWTESLWGSRVKNPDQPKYHRLRDIPDLPKALDAKAKDRDPVKKDRDVILARDGYQCRFCMIPVIPKEVRIFLNSQYPEDAYWRSARNADQHAALQCMWLQFDHLLPHCHGGDSSPDNVVVTCGVALTGWRNMAF